MTTDALALAPAAGGEADSSGFTGAPDVSSLPVAVAALASLCRFSSSISLMKPSTSRVSSGVGFFALRRYSRKLLIARSGSSRF